MKNSNKVYFIEVYSNEFGNSENKAELVGQEEYPSLLAAYDAVKDIPEMYSGLNFDHLEIVDSEDLNRVYYTFSTFNGGKIHEPELQEIIDKRNNAKAENSQTVEVDSAEVKKFEVGKVYHLDIWAGDKFKVIKIENGFVTFKQIAGTSDKTRRCKIRVMDFSDTPSICNGRVFEAVTIRGGYIYAIDEVIEEIDAGADTQDVVIDAKIENAKAEKFGAVRKEISKDDYKFFIGRIEKIGNGQVGFIADTQKKAVELLGKEIPQNVIDEADNYKAFNIWLGSEVNPIIDNDGYKEEIIVIGDGYDFREVKEYSPSIEKIFATVTTEIKPHIGGKYFMQIDDSWYQQSIRKNFATLEDAVKVARIMHSELRKVSRHICATVDARTVDISKYCFRADDWTKFFEIDNYGNEKVLRRETVDAIAKIENRTVEEVRNDIGEGIDNYRIYKNSAAAVEEGKSDSAYWDAADKWEKESDAILEKTVYAALQNGNSIKLFKQGCTNLEECIELIDCYTLTKKDAEIPRTFCSDMYEEGGEVTFTPVSPKGVSYSLADYKTKEQFQAVAAKLAESIQRGDKQFIFPTIEELNTPAAVNSEPKKFEIGYTYAESNSNGTKIENPYIYKVIDRTATNVTFEQMNGYEIYNHHRRRIEFDDNGNEYISKKFKMGYVNSSNCISNPLKDKIARLKDRLYFLDVDYLRICRDAYVKIDGEYFTADKFDDYATKYADTFYYKDGDKYIEDAEIYHELKRFERELNANYSELERLENIEGKADILKAKVAEQKNRRNKSIIDWSATLAEMKFEEIKTLQSKVKNFLKLGEIELAESIFNQIKILCRNYREQLVA